MTGPESNSREQFDFQKLLSQVVEGDEIAASQLVQTFEPEVRRFIRFRLANSNLRQFIDSLDICQSVLGRFFIELEKGALDLHSPEQLRSLLMKMAKNRFLSKVRHQQAARRDIRRIEGSPNEQLNFVAQKNDSPSEYIASQELVSMIRERLPADSKYLVEQRLSGREWGDLAKELGLTAEAARKRMTRALDDVARELGLADRS